MPQPSGAPFVAETLQVQKRRIVELEARVHELTEALVRAHATMDSSVRALKHQANELHTAAADAYRAWDKKTA